MYRDHTVGVVIPAHNEAPFVGDVIDSLPAFVDRVYAVDDASTDGTWDVLRARCRDAAQPDGTAADEPATEPDRATRQVASPPVTDGGGTGFVDGDDDPPAAAEVADDASATTTTEAARATATDDAAALATDDAAAPATDDAAANDGVATTDAVREVVAERVTAVRELEGGGGQRLVALRHAENRGVGAAIKTGYRQAYADGVDVVAVMDGDGQMDPGLLDRLLDPVVTGQAEYAKGNRLFSPIDRAEMSRWRLLGNALLTGLTKAASGYWKMVDPQNGYNAISWRALDTVPFEALFDGYGFRNDLLVALNGYGLTVADVEMPAQYGEETSGIVYREFVPRLSYLLLRGFLWRLKVKYVVRDFHPLVGLYGIGALGLAVWIADAVRALVRRDRAPSDRLSSVALFVASGTAVVLAMVFDMLANESLHTEVDDDS